MSDIERQGGADHEIAKDKSKRIKVINKTKGASTQTCACALPPILDGKQGSGCDFSSLLLPVMPRFFWDLDTYRPLRLASLASGKCREYRKSWI
jgi:hypothetical protein